MNPVGFVFSCAQWARLNTAQKVRKLQGLTKFFPIGFTFDAAVRALDAYCFSRVNAPVVSVVNFNAQGIAVQQWTPIRVMSAGRILPAGQTDSTDPSTYGTTSEVLPDGTILDPQGNTVPNAVGFNSNGQPVDASGNALNWNGTLVTSTSTPTTPTTTPTTVSPQATNPAMYNAIASGLGTSATAISNIFASNNQVAMAQLAFQNQQYLANLQAQLATSPNNPQLLAQQQQAQFLQQQLTLGSQNTLIVAGVIGLGIVVFGAVYLIAQFNRPQQRSRSSSSSRRSQRSRE